MISPRRSSERRPLAAAAASDASSAEDLPGRESFGRAGVTAEGKRRERDSIVKLCRAGARDVRRLTPPPPRECPCARARRGCGGAGVGSAVVEGENTRVRYPKFCLLGHIFSVCPDLNLPASSERVGYGPPLWGRRGSPLTLKLSIARSSSHSLMSASICCTRRRKCHGRHASSGDCLSTLRIFGEPTRKDHFPHFPQSCVRHERERGGYTPAPD